MAEQGTDRPVTVADLQAHQVWFGAEMSKISGEMSAEMSKMSGEMSAEMSKISGEMSKMSSDMKLGFADAKMSVEVLRQEVNADLDAAMHETKAEIAQLRRELADGLERVETRLLTSFHGWARTYESKSRGLSTWS